MAAKTLAAQRQALTPLRGMKNIGPTIADRLEQVGLRTRADLAAIGAAQAYLRIKAAHAGKTIPVCYYLYSLQGALDDVHWNELPERTKQRLLQEVAASSR